MASNLLDEISGTVEIDGHQVKAFRKMRNLTPQQLATSAGCGKKTIENWEAKGVVNADIDIVRRVAAALGVEPEEFLTTDYRQKLARAAKKLHVKQPAAAVKSISASRKPCNLPPSIGTLFKGREEFMAKLRAKLREAGVKAAAITTRKAIHGLGGVGKTQAAIEFGWANQDDYNALLYLVAETPGLLLTNLAQLAGVLELPERELREDDQRAEAVLRWLQAHHDWLLLIDNVDTDEAAQGVIERLGPVQGGHVVITSRLTRWPAHFEPLELDVLDIGPAADYLLEAARQRTKGDDDLEQARQIAEDVDGLALALTQAAGYVDKYRISFAEYRRRWHENIAKVAAWHDKRTMGYPRSLAVTWNTTVDGLPPPARVLLELLSLLAPEPIPRELVTGKTSAAPLDAAGIAEPEEALAELADVSMAKLDGETVELHRLVMEITRSRIPSAPPNEPEASATDAQPSLTRPARRLGEMLAVVTAYPLGDGTDVRSWPRWIPMAEHAAALVDRADAAKIAQPTTRLMNDLGLFLAVRIRLPEAERLFRRALAIDEQSFGPEHPNVAALLNNLAQLLAVTNRLAEAEPLMWRALAIDEQSFGPEHPKVAGVLDNLGRLLQDTDRLAEAEPLMRRALAIDEQSFGPEHPNVAKDLNNLAQLLAATNRLVEAEPLMWRALAIAEQSFGPEHPNVATALNNLGRLLQDTNRLAEAEPLMRRALAIDEQSFRPEHPHVATALNNLGRLLQDTNRLAEAEPLMRRALAIDEQSFGPEHPKVANALNMLARLLQDTNRLVEAEPLMRRALAIDEQSFGPEHPKVARDLNILAGLLLVTNRLAEVEPLMRRVLAVLVKFNEASGHEHPYFRTAVSNYRRILADMGGSVDEIVAAVREVLEGTPEPK